MEKKYIYERYKKIISSKDKLIKDEEILLNKIESLKNEVSELKEKFNEKKIELSKLNEENKEIAKDKEINRSTKIMFCGVGIGILFAIIIIFKEYCYEIKTLGGLNIMSFFAALPVLIGGAVLLVISFIVATTISGILVGIINFILPIKYINDESELNTIIDLINDKEKLIENTSAEYDRIKDYNNDLNNEFINLLGEI